MTEATMTKATTHTLEVPGAVLTYDVRENESSTKAPLLLIGLPMGAGGYGSLVSHFTDRTVITYDPRGVERSRKTDGVLETTPDQHADDLHELIKALGGERADVFGSSGGGVTGLALVTRHPDDVRTLVAHEPPIAEVLPDHEQAHKAVLDMCDTYQRSGFAPAMVKFIAIVSHQGPIPADFADQPQPDPQMFGMPTEDDGSRDDILFAQNVVGITRYRPDFEALRVAPTRVVLAAGEESDGILASRAAFAIAESLGTSPVIFPGGHNGFMGGEYGQPAGKPAEFAVKLREVLDA